jgi:CRISPR-associated protein Csm4
MALYRYHITPLSAFATPMRSDTLYGHLLWAAAMLYGEQRVTAMIAAFAGEEPPFVLSSALPSGRLPLPPLPGIPRQRFKEQFAQQEQLCEMLKRFKAFRKQPCWDIDQWQRLQGKLSQEALFAEWLSAKTPRTGAGDEPEQVHQTQPHVTIDRQSGSVLEQGGLFFSSATWYRPGAVLDLYVESRQIDLFEELFGHLAAIGFGADRSTGKGHFCFKRDESFDPVPFGANGSHHLSLSVCVATDMSSFAGYWTPFVKHGRAWSGFSEKNPFKKPFFAFSEGSLFSRMPQGGYLLRNIHSDPKLVQIGWPLTIPVTLEGHHAD